MPTNNYRNYVTGRWIGDELVFNSAAGVTVTPEKLESISNAQSATIRMELRDPVSETIKKAIDALKEAKNKPMPEVIMEREKKGGHYTTVKWADGTYTTVKASEGDAGDRSPYMAFCAALAKKLYGSNSAVHRVVNRHMESYIADEKKKAAAAKRAKEREAEQAAHERALLREAKRLRLKEEAKDYNRAHKQDEE